MKVYYTDVSKSILDVKQDKRNECFNFGKDNAYPSLIEALVKMSVTSKNCVDKVAKAIYGGGFGEAGNIKVNSKGQTLNKVLRIAARQYAKHKNCYIQVSYNLNYKFSSIVVVPVKYVRVGKADDRGYSGKFLVYDNWDRSKGSRIMSSKFLLVDKFNPDEDVVKKQIGGKDIEEYNGQIIHIKEDDGEVYSESDLTSVLSEALLESNSQTIRSRGAEKGFINSKICAVPPFSDKKDRDDFKKNLKSMQGANNSSDVLVVEASEATEDLSKSIYLGDLTSTYNDKMFEYSDKKAEASICKAFGVNLVLISPNENSIFGNSGEVLREAKKQLYDEKKEDRDQIEEVFSDLMKSFKKPIEDGVEIQNPYLDDVDEGAEDENANAQAVLRGSVGGVTALLAIQQSVANRTTTKEAGIAMIVNIYGFDEDKASDMLGDPIVVSN